MQAMALTCEPASQMLSLLNGCLTTQAIHVAARLGIADELRDGTRRIGDLSAALDTGCIAFLTKPFSTQALIEPLNKAAAGRS